MQRVTTSLTGADLLNNPRLNKGTAFTQEERKRFRLNGLLPPQVSTIDEQAARLYHTFQRKPNELEKHVYLRGLQDRNEVLFYYLLLHHIEEMVPIVYTPIVAHGCRQFSQMYRRPRGLFISFPQRHFIADILRNRPHPEVDVIVATDGERVLGIGDQGVGGMGISVGKLSLYTLIGGIEPSRTLPVVLDAGTNNEELLYDPEYLGWRHERITGQEYFDFVDLFVEAVKQELPNACLQWEDFANQTARPILERYRDQLLTFNDDIQGTAAVTLGALLSAIKASGTSLKDQEIVFLGGGTAAIGVAECIRSAMVEDGLSPQQASTQFWIIDKDGLLHSERQRLSDAQRVFAQPLERVTGWPRSFHGQIGLADVIGQIRATALIGLSTVGGAFTETIVREMASKVDRPIIFPLSNPTDKSEAVPQDLAAWTAGRALVATGSPFPHVSQCNNVYIFPALGLALVASGARRVTDAMILASARALAAASPTSYDPAGPLLPALADLRRIAVEVAVAAGLAAHQSGVAPAMTRAELRSRVVASQWLPEYPEFV